MYIYCARCSGSSRETYLIKESSATIIDADTLVSRALCFPQPCTIEPHHLGLVLLLVVVLLCSYRGRPNFIELIYFTHE